ncbi:MAG: putative addiction module antidote protein [Gammaproteobacteria bacterium]|nr:putative addiction module antidote protein [Gammaproteobacteria bacterium]MBU1655844.1 putative addiction module antidote protein [Gammaproteobacteria bacterium]MBU1960079.1 putative addiction module antidote protein [Gammaproteobacteria bacterium]
MIIGDSTVNNNLSAPYSPADYLQTPEDVANYLDAALEDGDERVLMMALRNVANAQGGVARVAEITGLNREALYRTLSENGNPRLNTLTSILHAMGLRLSVAQEQRASG